MAGLLDMIMKSQNGASVEQLAKSFGISGNDAAKAIASLLPGLAGGVQKNIANPQELEGLVKALSSGKHQQYLDQPDTMTRPEAVQDGNNILGHLLGSKDESRQLASQAAASTGIDAGILKKMLPMVAGMVMAGLSKQGNAMGAMNQLGNGAVSQSTGLGSMLGSFLDADKDGSVMDDVLGMARKFL
jgi:hypothetical protein